jgi:hypothetical protein
MFPLYISSETFIPCRTVGGRRPIQETVLELELGRLSIVGLFKGPDFTWSPNSKVFGAVYYML